ncbi:RNA-binding region RNP-1 domain-containing protein [Tieghemostelium lacteum]|uniref:RNA-binding region RNP-1 domain-containing protein n=1 Tax=Tieghemostelium lacteum TaxID=361077 RepID=A0A151ZK50_TIELA|nr:RNA-binding region RNP-1 domain-containing protein [Tieghemostelium lacteum]|eukprot:KYQ94260.1 RNA-binding region RNP-1 domain-containing protein [Tieghemostelium lacteum]
MENSDEEKNISFMNVDSVSSVSDKKKEPKFQFERSRSRSKSPVDMNRVNLQNNNNNNNNNNIIDSKDSESSPSTSKRSKSRSRSRDRSRERSHRSSRRHRSSSHRHKRDRSRDRDRDRDKDRDRDRSRERDRDRSRDRERRDRKHRSSKRKSRSRSRSRDLDRKERRDKESTTNGSGTAVTNETDGTTTTTTCTTSSSNSPSIPKRSRSKERKERHHRKRNRSESRSRSRSKSNSRDRERGDRDRDRDRERGERDRDRDSSHYRPKSPTRKPYDSTSTEEPPKKKLTGWDVNLPTSTENNEQVSNSVSVSSVPTSPSKPLIPTIPSVVSKQLSPITSSALPNPLIPHQPISVSNGSNGHLSPSSPNPIPNSSTAALSPNEKLTLQQLQQQQQNQEQIQCRIYVGSLNFNLTEQDITNAFAPFGIIKSLVLGKDGVGKSKGYCFIEYDSPESATNAINSMSKHYMGGRLIKVARPFIPTGNSSTNTIITNPFITQLSPPPPPLSTPQSPIPTPTFPISPQIHQYQQLQQVSIPIHAGIAVAQGQSHQPPLFIPPPPIIQSSQMTPLQPPLIPQPTLPTQQPNQENRIYIGSIPWNVTEDIIKSTFCGLGNILSCTLMNNPDTNRHKGYGFIDFETKKSADDAILTMNGFEINGRPIKVGRPVKGISNPTSSSSTSNTNSGSNSSTVSPLVVNNNKHQTNNNNHDNISLDDDNISISAEQRYILTQKLMGKDTNNKCLVLRNLMGSEDESDEFLEQDIKEECSKFGEIESIVIKNDINQLVKIFILFKDSSACIACKNKQNGRFFGGRSIKAEFYDVNLYNKKIYN